MVLPVTHVLSTFLLLEAYKFRFKQHSKFFTPFTYFLAFIAAGLPDIDIIITLFLNFIGISVPLLHHRAFTHTPIFALIFLFAGIIFWKAKKENLGFYCYLVFGAILLHLALDTFIGITEWRGIMWLWPVSDYRFSTYVINKTQFYYTTIALDISMLFAYIMIKAKQIQVHQDDNKAGTEKAD